MTFNSTSVLTPTGLVNVLALPGNIVVFGESSVLFRVVFTQYVIFVFARVAICTIDA